MLNKFVVAFAILFLAVVGNEASAKDSFESSQVCKDCHRDIYRNWRKSLHALSYSNPIFQTAYRKAYTDTKGEARKYCLNCHAPTVRVTGDFDADDAITREGITCDFCHSISSVDLEKPDPFTVKPGKVKRSVLDGASSPYHETVRSDDFASSKLCAGCHDFKNRNGVHVGVTYSEWKDSAFAKEGKQCQNCHMPEIAGKTAHEGGREKIHDHSLTHNVGSMLSVVKLKMVEMKRGSKNLVTKVSLTNSGIGHSIPTGTPARRLVLEVSTRDGEGKVIETKRKEYGKTIVDSKGIEIETDGDVFLFGSKIVGDNRLKSGESRTETFFFETRIGDVKDLSAEVFFFYNPVIAEKNEMRIQLSGDEWEVKP